MAKPFFPMPGSVHCKAETKGQDRVFVLGLPLDATEESVSDLFGYHGTVTKVFLLPRRDETGARAAIVKLLDEEHARTCVNGLVGYVPDGMTRALTITFAFKRKEDEATETVFVTGIPINDAVATINDVFAPYGTIKWTKVLQPRKSTITTSAFVRMADVEEARMCVDFLDQSPLLNHKELLSVKFAEDKPMNDGNRRNTMVDGILTIGSPASGGGKGGSAPGSVDGDWSCPSCGFNVFASKQSCFKCGTVKPAGGVKRAWTSSYDDNSWKAPRVVPARIVPARVVAKPSELVSRLARPSGSVCPPTSPASHWNNNSEANEDLGTDDYWSGGTELAEWETDEYWDDSNKPSETENDYGDDSWV